MYVCACFLVADKASSSISLQLCGFSLHLTPAVPGALSEPGEVVQRGGGACSVHLRRGFSSGAMWLPAPSASQSDALEAQGVKAIVIICQAEPV